MPAANVEKTVSEPKLNPRKHAILRSSSKLLVPSWYILILLALLGCGLVLWKQKSFSIVYADKQPVIVELAQTDEEQTLGLSGRNSLSKGYGMLFEFDIPSNACMWMKDMKFGIDVYWYSATGQLISSRTDIKPESFPSIYCPDLRASYMLEVNTGQFSKAPKRLNVPVNQ